MIARRYADTPHGQVHYRITGDGDALVLLGPAGRSAAMYDPLAALLADQFRVVPSTCSAMAVPTPCRKAQRSTC